MTDTVDLLIMGIDRDRLLLQVIGVLSGDIAVELTVRFIDITDFVKIDNLRMALFQPAHKFLKIDAIKIPDLLTGRSCPVGMVRVDLPRLINFQSWMIAAVTLLNFYRQDMR